MNGCWNFWNLLKREIHGIYASAKPFYLFSRVNDQAVRYNQRGLKDTGRFDLAGSQIVGRRLTHAELTWHAEDEPFQLPGFAGLGATSPLRFGLGSTFLRNARCLRSTNDCGTARIAPIVASKRLYAPEPSWQSGRFYPSAIQIGLSAKFMS